jgi:hypothetical protein
MICILFAWLKENIGGGEVWKMSAEREITLLSHCGFANNPLRIATN